MAPLSSKYPLKAIITALTLVLSPIQLLLLTIYYLPRFLRPNTKWSLRTTLGNQVLRIMYRYIAIVQLKPIVYDLNHTKAKKLKDRFVLVKPAPKDKYFGVLDHAGIKPASVPAIWFPEPFNQKKHRGRTVVIHFQGGAFVSATDPLDTGKFPSGIFEKEMDALTFYAQYRLSRTEDSRFPAALQDLVSSYQYVLDLGIEPSNILISGDSAGGNLVIALVRYIEDCNGVLPRPRGAMAWSPWVDITEGALGKHAVNRKFPTDFLNIGFMKWGIEAYRPSSPAAEREDVHAYVSPAGHPFATSIPLFIHVGSSEVLYEEGRQFANDMKAVEGNRIRYFETPHAPHDLIQIGIWTGLVRETEDAVRDANSFFEDGK